MLLLWVEHSRDVLSYLVRLVEENDDVRVERLLQAVLALDNFLDQGKKATLRVVPGVRA